MNGKYLQGKLALVTGGSRGIGAATAVALAQAGADVCISYNQAAEKAADVTQKLIDLGVAAKAYKADMGSRPDIREMVAQITLDFKNSHPQGILVLVNNAGLVKDEPFSALSDEAWDRTLAVNLTGPVFLAREVVRGMRKAKWGRIINVASLAGERGTSNQTAYAAAKGGLIAFTKALCFELAPKGITVNAVSPGFIDTDMMRSVGELFCQGIAQACPMHRMGTPEEVASLIAYLAGDNAAFITGQVYGVNGGLHT